MTSSSGLPANFAVVRADGTPYPPHYLGPNENWTDEIALDLASSHTIAPNANIVLVLDNQLDLSTVITTILNSGNHSFADFSNTFVSSNSWGSNEYFDPTLEMNLQKAAMSGMSVNFSSADCGDGSYNSHWPCTHHSHAPVVQYPASSANATAIGGTSLFVDSNHHYAFESGWGSVKTVPPSITPTFYAGSTGGISNFYSAPQWQKNTTFQGFTAGGYGVIANYQ